MPTDAVRESPGEELGATPGEAVHRHDPANAGQADAPLVKKDRPEGPDQRVDELLDQARLADGGHALVAPAHQREHLPRWSECAHASGVPGRKWLRLTRRCRFTSSCAQGRVSATASQASSVAGR